MESVKEFGIVWKVMFIIASVVAAAWAVDNRYVTDAAFTAFKEGTITALISRLDRIESKLDTVISERKK